MPARPCCDTGATSGTQGSAPSTARWGQRVRRERVTAGVPVQSGSCVWGPLLWRRQRGARGQISLEPAPKAAAVRVAQVSAASQVPEPPPAPQAAGAAEAGQGGGFPRSASSVPLRAGGQGLQRLGHGGAQVGGGSPQGAARGRQAEGHSGSRVGRRRVADSGRPSVPVKRSHCACRRRGSWPSREPPLCLAPELEEGPRVPRADPGGQRRPAPVCPARGCPAPRLTSLIGMARGP